MTRPENPTRLRPLPPLSSLSPTTLAFLNTKLTAEKDLHDVAPTLVSGLQTDCQNLEQNLFDLSRQFSQLLTDYTSHSHQIGAICCDIKSKLSDLHSSTVASASSPDGGSGRLLGEELPALAKEVARVEAVRTYAETALKLDTLVGDMEDAVSAIVNRTLRRQPSRSNTEDMRVGVIRTLKLIEDQLTSIKKKNPRWTQLVSAVDHRVDRALALLRPQAVADHRALLASLKWPPPLSSLNSLSLETKGSADVQNPLLTVQGDLKQQYCESFLALCNLQELQRRRKSRQLEGHNREVALRQPLWAIEELVNPLSIDSQKHFSKWIDKPEYIFALVYKITRDFVDSLDEMLQPLVDEALLSGYSCREEWVSAMVNSLSTSLAKDIFPVYVTRLEEESTSGILSNARISWLHLIDLMISFDKRVWSLVAHAGISLSFPEDGNQHKIASLSVFCDRPDWLDLWAEIELSDTIEKLKPDMEDERSWMAKNQGAALISGQEDQKSPPISSVILHRLSLVVDRCRSIPSVPLRSRFVTLTCVPIIQKFLDCLLLRCLEAEGLTALTDDDALIKVAISINAAFNFASVLKEWCEDVFFLEIGLNQDDQLETSVVDFSGGSEVTGDNFVDKEVSKLDGFRLEWVEKLSTVILRGFDACCRDYMKNRRQWQEKVEEGLAVSRSFLGALDYLEGKLSVLEEHMNAVDFVRVWRSLASGIDQFIFNGIFMSNMKFHNGGVQKLGNDLEILFGVFRRWCLRPEGFFPKVNEGLKLLKIETNFQNCLVGGERWLRDNRLTHLTLAEAEKIVKNRVYVH